MIHAGPLLRTAAAIAALSGLLGMGPALNGQAPANELEVLPVQNGLYLIAGAGGNILVQVSGNGVLLVDAGAPGTSDAVLAAIKSVSLAPVRYIIDTSGDDDHTGGNEPLSTSGANESVNVPGNSGFAIQTAPIVAHEATYLRMSAPTGVPSARPFGAWPTSTFFTAKKTMAFAGEPIEILFQPAAHTDGDVIVFFRQADVIAAGDVFVTDGYPVIDVLLGGTIQGLIDAANRIIDITIPRFNQQGGTLVVPGHGRISNEADVVEYRDMITIIRDRVQRRIDAGRTLDEILADGVTADYDGVHGATTGPWTTPMFVEAVYRTLTGDTP